VSRASRLSSRIARRLWLLVWLGAWLATILMPLPAALAQEERPPGPVYIVQPGDTLWDIAQRFGVTVEDLRAYNGLAETDLLAAGFELVIPGLEGMQGELVTRTVPYGESLRSLSRRYQVPVEALVKLNRLVSPAELYSGSTLIISEASTGTAPGRRVTVAPGQSLLELAVLQGVSPWALLRANHLRGSWEALPGDVLRAPGADSQAGPGGLPGEILAVEVDPLPLMQGITSVIRVKTSAELDLAGQLVGRELRFHPLISPQDESADESAGTQYVALQGVHVMTRPGFYPLEVRGRLPSGAQFAFSQRVYVRDGNYGYDQTLIVKPETIDPANTKPEDDLWNSFPRKVTAEKKWDGIFQFPASPLFANCYPSFFGQRRSYNNGPYDYFHTGLDICGGVGAEVFAPAPGTVVFTGTLTVRGNAIMIDHGWGVYTGYMHLSEILVQIGDEVETGQLIGRVGGTGRVTGSHLHWEIWVGDVLVEPLDWLDRAYP
jgi:murein DD-endopeptidase MepM/ murein hydrolase activator NlpD